MGLYQATKDSCFFIQKDNIREKPDLMISVLVDDLLIMGASEDDFSQKVFKGLQSISV